MTQAQVLYEVNLEVAQHRAAEFDAWLGEHVSQMLALPGFVAAKMLTQADGDQAVARRSVHYELRDSAALERYFDEHAERMRAQGVARFGDDLRATRRVLTTQNASSAERCANCDSALASQYCGECGQRHQTRMISVFELTRDVFEDIFRWDSRVWRSLRPLLLSPGTLTNEYLDGRRTYYTPPLRMYFVISIAFFLLTSLPAFEDFNAAGMLGIQSDEDGSSLVFSEKNLEAEIAAQDGAPADDDDDDSGLTEEDCDITLDEMNVPGLSKEAVEKRINELCRRGTTPEGRRAFANEFTDLAPKLLIIMLPIIALASKVIYPLSRRYYVEHLLFYTHFHSFVFLLLIVIMLITVLAARVPVLSVNTSLLGVAGGLYAIYYLYRALRRVFRQGRLATFFKMFLIWIFYTVGTVLLTTIGALIAALSL